MRLFSIDWAGRTETDAVVPASQLIAASAILHRQGWETTSTSRLRRFVRRKFVSFSTRGWGLAARLRPSSRLEACNSVPAGRYFAHRDQGVARDSRPDVDTHQRSRNESPPITSPGT